MRKRQNNMSSDETTRPHGPLTDDEIQEIRRAYQEGCQGEILIGMRGEERVITMLLPAQSFTDNSEVQRQRILAKLKEIECDKYICIKKGHGSNHNDNSAINSDKSTASQNLRSKPDKS